MGGGATVYSKTSIFYYPQFLFQRAPKAKLDLAMSGEDVFYTPLSREEAKDRDQRINQLRYDNLVIDTFLVSISTYTILYPLLSR